MDWVGADRYAVYGLGRLGAHDPAAGWYQAIGRNQGR
jgi:hypothetical protein